ncbi:uncharacterized protein mspo isoform X2 [Venturia canescens]|uniref:uncharacterized protein mspo isoform X2 n=1 Tax=Venturia canescens TaxID=32260 RepID=UPI001C9C7E4E|nr:uncharacterized protein LOC122407793 isoform X2 [Venturia canescens]
MKEMSGVGRLCRSVLFSLLLLVCFELCSHQASGQCGPGSQDRQDKLALYKVILRTYWSRARFPKHYPEWRPPAQFGKLVGRTHDATYSLYRLGERLTAGGTQYVETGRTDGLDTGGESSSILNTFTGPSIPQGEGNSIARAFLDGNHSLVSIMARINPSPDWFVGVDSFQLCVEGNWVDTVTVELDPLDGGTDNGFTFTAANWPTRPQGIVYRITSRYPAHPAGSFYYPILPRLPPIATLTFTKLKEYTLTETYHEDDVEVEFVSNVSQQNGAPTPRGTDPNREVNEEIAEERREMDTQRYRYWTTGSGEQQGEVTVEPSHKNEAPIIEDIASSFSLARSKYSERSEKVYDSRQSENGIHPDQDSRGRFANEKPREEGEKTASSFLSNSQENSENKEDLQDRGSNSTSPNGHAHRAAWTSSTPVTTKHQHKLRMKHRRLQFKGPPRDCKVDDWGPWSACSRSCGVGETQRTRQVKLSPRRRGAPCPPLKETKWCGSASPCPANPESAKPSVDLFQW